MRIMAAFQKLLIFLCFMHTLYSFTGQFQKSTSQHSMFQYSLHMHMHMLESPAAATHVDFKLVTYNILAPCYRRVKSDAGTQMESEGDPELFLERNSEICRKLRESDADIIFIQEFWSQNDQLRQLFLRELCQPAPSTTAGGYEGGYTMRELNRTSQWRTRDDGLCVFVRDTVGNQSSFIAFVYWNSFRITYAYCAIVLAHESSRHLSRAS